jgi:hypothetical protein
MWNLFNIAAQAQDVITIPVVPSTVAPILAWVMTIAGSIITLFVPLVAIWFKQYLSIQNASATKFMVNSAITHAAHLADLDMTDQHLTINQVAPVDSPTMVKALDYVTQSCALSGVADAGDDHTSRAIVAELHHIQLNKATNTVPSVVLSPVSAVR